MRDDSAKENTKLSKFLNDLSPEGKVLLITDKTGLTPVLQMIPSFESSRIHAELYILEKKESVSPLSNDTIKHRYLNIFELQEMLYAQKMGTRLYLAGNWETIDRLYDMALEAGFTEEEIETDRIGPQPLRVFCVKCYKISQIDDPEDNICHHCGTRMDISNHFSRRLKAYLGYIVSA